MTKAELINIFSEKAGIAESDSRISFEILLTKLSGMLKSGQSIFIPEFGYFHLIKGKIKSLAPEDSENIYEELIDIILYSSEKKLSQSETEGIVFNIPSNDDETSSLVDSYFSLSIGKPLIPLRGYFDRQNYIPSSGYEYKKYLGTKVDKLIVKSKIILSEEQFPTLIIDARSYNSNEVRLENAMDDLDTLLSDEQLTKKNINQKPDENIVKNIAWDFGDILSQKISAESILELTNERIKKSSSELIDKQNQTDNGISTLEQENVLNQLLENEKEKPELSSQTNEIVNKKNNGEKTPQHQTDSDDNLLNELMQFEEVQTGEVTKPPSQKAEEDLFENEFWKDTSKLFEKFDPHEIGPDDKGEFTEIKATDINLGEFSNNKSGKDLVESDEKSEEEISEATQRSKISISLDKEYKNNSSKKWVFVIPVLLILIVVVFYYWYTELYKKSEQLLKENVLSISSENANIIERDYRIPVSYPYIPEKSPVDSAGAMNPVRPENDSPVDEQKLNEKITTNQDISSTMKDNVNKNLIPEGRPVSLGKNIYKYGNIYVVQVASFRSDQIAENEAGKYRNKGFNAFIEPVEIEGKGKWYRIKVGNFASLSEAENFISKNIH